MRKVRAVPKQKPKSHDLCRQNHSSVVIKGVNDHTCDAHSAYLGNTSPENTMELYVGFYISGSNLGPMFHGDIQAVHSRLKHEVEQLDVRVPPLKYFEDSCEYDAGDLTLYVGLSESA